MPNRASRALPSPTEAEQRDPIFLAILRAIKGWDIRTADELGYATCGANGSHALMILKEVQAELALELACINAHRCPTCVRRGG